MSTINTNHRAVNRHVLEHRICLALSRVVDVRVVEERLNAKDNLTAIRVITYG
jgi:hypothetical protein